MKKTLQKNNEGQIMLMSVIMMGGILLSATAIAGLLMIFQIRQANDSVNSARAFFAADSALEGQTYEALGLGTRTTDFDTANIRAEASSSAVGNLITIRSEGFSGNAVRSLEAVLVTE